MLLKKRVEPPLDAAFNRFGFALVGSSSTASSAWDLHRVVQRLQLQAHRTIVQFCIIESVEIVIDTSALLAVIGEQPEKADLVRLTRGATLVAPASVHWEVGNVLSAMFKRKAIGIREAFELLEAYAAIPVRIATVGLKQAVELSARLNVYAYDAYLLTCSINQRAPLLTLDGGLKARARELQLEVLEAGIR